jgi:hypothetical protein
MRRIQLGDLPQQTYDALEKEVLLLAGSHDAGMNVTLTHEDVYEHSVKIGSTRELVYAVQDYPEAGFVVIAANIQSDSYMCWCSYCFNACCSYRFSDFHFYCVTCCSCSCHSHQD